MSGAELLEHEGAQEQHLLLVYFRVQRKSLAVLVPHDGDGQVPGGDTAGDVGAVTFLEVVLELERRDDWRLWNKREQKELK